MAQENNAIRTALTILALIGVILICIVPTVYLISPVVLDHAGEVTMASIAWLLYSGQPLYTAIDAPERYSLEHGPVAYLVIGAVMKLLGPNIHTAKLASYLTLLTVTLVSWHLFNRYLDRRTAFWLLGLQTWLLLKYYYLYLARDDVLMVLCVVLSIYFSTTERPRLLVLVGTAVFLGILLNTKIHGILYAIPVLAILFQRLGFVPLLLTLGGMVGVGLLPFLLPTISLAHYLQWIFLAKQVGLSPKTCLGNLSMATLFAALPLSLAIYCGIDPRSFFRQNKFFIISLAITLVTVAIIGGKRGSGSHHLAPFIPTIMYLIVILTSHIPEAASRPAAPLGGATRGIIGRALLPLLFLAIVMGAINGQGRILHYMIVNSVDPAMVTELRQLQDKYRNDSMMIGYGEDPSYKNYDELIPQLVFAGNPYLLDISALNDMEAAGLPIPASTRNAIAAGIPRIWLIPAGNSPFSLTNGYNGTPLFDEPFRQTFFTHYELKEKTHFFDVWAYTGNHGPQ